MERQTRSEHPRPAFTWIDVGFPATFADIATPFHLLRNNLRGPSAAAQRITKFTGKTKFILLKCLTGLVYVELKLIHRLLGVEVSTSLCLFEGLHPAQYFDPFSYSRQRGVYHFKHDLTPQATESAQDTTHKGGLH